MAGSATPSSADAVRASLDATRLPQAVAVACSGGLDSTALLHATCARAASEGLQVWALHVHHGLMPQADAWLAHVEALCRRWRRSGRPVEFLSRRLAGSPPAGESVEAWAREHRYAALAAMARDAGCLLVLLAHHRRDQAETFLLQALRGAGPAGLSAMPAARVIDGITFARPWLDRPRSDIEAYARRMRLRWVDDGSNEDPRHARSRLRADLWPTLESRFPGAEAALADAARWQAETAALVDEVAQADLVHCAVPARSGGGRGPAAQALAVGNWLALSVPRRAAVLRAWWQVRMQVPLSASLCRRLLDELPTARSGARWPVRQGSRAAAVELRVYRGVLDMAPSVRVPVSPPVGRVAAEEPGSAATCVPPAPLASTGPGRYGAAGWAGEWRVTAAVGDGLARARLHHLRAVRREGAEHFQCGAGRPPRLLKKQYQAAGVPPWQRDGPLLFDGDQIVHVPGLGIDARCWASPESDPVQIEWVPAEAAP